MQAKEDHCSWCPLARFYFRQLLICTNSWDRLVNRDQDSHVGAQECTYSLGIGRQEWHSGRKWLTRAQPKREQQTS